ncbi:MAG: hypothetical protein V4598_08700 [Bdellovibrionota bacterium]
MKTFLVLFVLILGEAQAKDAICPKPFIKSVKAEVLARTNRVLRKIHKAKPNDKNAHCAVSCILTHRCYASDVLALGVGKEIWDVFTPGDADILDLQADIRGIRLSTSGRARDKADCFKQCDAYYPFK